MRLTFHGGARTVTGSKYLLDTGDLRILVDCGLFQGEARDEEHFNHLPFDPNEVDFAVMTHGHLDHVGLLPLMVKDGWTGTVLSTAATRDVATFILYDSSRQLDRAYGRADYHFTGDHVEETLNRWRAVPYDKWHDLGRGVRVRLHEAGHILGSSSVEVEVKRNGTTKRVVFSGDLGRPGTPILRDPARIPGADVLLIESTYGNRLHDMAKNRGRLKEVVRAVAKENGHLLIPAFAIGRTQVLLWELNHLVESGEVPRVPVFLDSPLGINVTGLYRRHDSCFDEETRKQLDDGDQPFDFPGLQETRNWRQSAAIQGKAGPAVIIAGSGMMHGGRILGHLKQFLDSPKTTVLVVGFQARGTLGRRLLEGAEEVTIQGQPIRVRAKVKTINGFSAHADRDELLDWLGNFGEKPETVFCTHGEAGPAEALAVAIEDRFGIRPAVPDVGDSIEI